MLKKHSHCTGIDASQRYLLFPCDKTPQLDFVSRSNRLMNNVLHYASKFEARNVWAAPPSLKLSHLAISSLALTLLQKMGVPSASDCVQFMSSRLYKSPAVIAHQSKLAVHLFALICEGRLSPPPLSMLSFSMRWRLSLLQLPLNTTKLWCQTLETARHNTLISLASRMSSFVEILCADMAMSAFLRRVLKHLDENDKYCCHLSSEPALVIKLLDFHEQCVAFRSEFGDNDPILSQTAICSDIVNIRRSCLEQARVMWNKWFELPLVVNHHKLITDPISTMTLLQTTMVYHSSQPVSTMWPDTVKDRVHLEIFEPRVGISLATHDEIAGAASREGLLKSPAYRDRAISVGLDPLGFFSQAIKFKPVKSVHVVSTIIVKPEPTETASQPDPRSSTFDECDALTLAWLANVMEPVIRDTIMLYQLSMC